MFGLSTPAKQSRTDQIRERLHDLKNRREAILEASTARKLAKLESEEAELRQALTEAERAESLAKKSAPPSDEEADLWREIRGLMDQEQDVLRRAGGSIPQRFIRADSVEHFTSELASQRQAFELKTAELQSHQKMGRRLVEESNRLDHLERQFPQTILPLCRAGERLFSLRQKRTELSNRRDALRREREAAALASI